MFYITLCFQVKHRLWSLGGPAVHSRQAVEAMLNSRESRENIGDSTTNNTK